MTHIDDFLDRPYDYEHLPFFKKTSIEAMPIVILMLNYFRMPAGSLLAIEPAMKKIKLLCYYQDEMYFVTGSSRLGDIWLNKIDAIGNQHRVAIDEIQAFNFKVVK